MADNGDLTFEEWLSKPALERVIDQLGGALMDLRDLREWITGDELNGLRLTPLRIAAEHSFFISVRTVAEFFVRMPARDYTARDYLTGWQPRKALAKRLDHQWWWASKHTVHMSRERVPEDASEWSLGDGSYRALTAIARDCWTVAEEFTSAYEAVDGEYAVHFRDMVSGTRILTRKEQTYWAKVRMENRRREFDAAGATLLGD